MEQSSSKIGSGWGILIVLALVQFTHLLDFMILMPLGPQYLREMEIGPDQFSFLVSTYGFAACIGGLIAAARIDRYDRKRALLFFFGGFTIGTFLCGVAPDFWSLLGARAFTGFFGGVIGAMCLAVVGDLFPENRRGFATGIVMSSFSIVTIAGVPIGLLIAENLGKSAPFLLLGAMSVLLFAMAMWLLPPIRVHLEKPRSKVPLFQILRRRNHLWAYSLMIFLVIGTFMIVPFIATYLVFNGGLEQSNVKWIYLAGGLATMFTTPLFGRLSDKFGKLVMFRILATMSAIGILAVTNLTHPSLTMTLVVTTWFMVMASGRMVPAMALVTSSASPQYRGSFLSVNSSMQQAGMALATALAGQLLTQPIKTGPIHGFQTVGFVGLIVTLFSLILAGRIRPAVREESIPAINPEKLAASA